jgi:hypothetical protein
MKVGDLIYDETYGCGIIVWVDGDGVGIHFADNEGICFLGKELYDTVEVLG